jgi:hypothetical protein
MRVRAMKSGGGAKARGVEQALDHIWPDKIPEGLSAKERNVPHKEQSDNEVGYRRPPVAHQFKKGQSGNPKGRRKGSVSAVSHVANALNEFVVVQEKGERRSFSKLAVAAKQLVNKAVSGDLRA